MTQAPAPASPTPAPIPKPAAPVAAKPPAPPPPVGKRILFVMPPEGFHAEEFRSTLSSLRRHGMFCKVASTTTEKVVGGIDYYLPEMTFEQVDLNAWDGVVFLGGAGAAKLADLPKAIEIARAVHKAGKLVAAIGAGTVLLAKAGLLQGHRATGDATAKPIVESSGAKFTGAQIEPQWLHGNPHRIVTAADSGASHRFGQRIARDLAD